MTPVWTHYFSLHQGLRKIAVCLVVILWQYKYNWKYQNLVHFFHLILVANAVLVLMIGTDEPRAESFGLA